MAWSFSKIFRITLANALGNVTPLDLDADSFKLANYNNSITPDQNVTATLTAYNAASSQWTTTNEVSQAGQWAAGGITIASTVLDTSTNGIVMFDGADVASGSAATLSNVFGGLVYDDTLAAGTNGAVVTDQGLCYLYYGGAASVTNGTLTVQFASTGICRFDLTV
jgi:hypothetical protein